MTVSSATVEAPERAEYLRVIVAELQRNASHAMANGTLISDAGAWRTRFPRLSVNPPGAGDLTAAVFLANVLDGRPLDEVPSLWSPPVVAVQGRPARRSTAVHRLGRRRLKIYRRYM